MDTKQIELYWICKGYVDALDSSIETEDRESTDEVKRIVREYMNESRQAAFRITMKNIGQLINYELRL
jgi:hypothetical protein